MGVLNDMLHDHHKATRSKEADQIEYEIETGLENLQLLINEVRERMKRSFHPVQILSKRWVWVGVLVVYMSWRIFCLIKKYSKKYSKKNKWLLKALIA
jgi:hypothetical protein